MKTQNKGRWKKNPLENISPNCASLSSSNYLVRELGFKEVLALNNSPVHVPDISHNSFQLILTPAL